MRKSKFNLATKNTAHQPFHTQFPQNIDEILPIQIYFSSVLFTGNNNFIHFIPLRKSMYIFKGF